MRPRRTKRQALEKKELKISKYIHIYIIYLYRDLISGTNFGIATVGVGMIGQKMPKAKN